MLGAIARSSWRRMLTAMDAQRAAAAKCNPLPGIQRQQKRENTHSLCQGAAVMHEMRRSVKRYLTNRPRPTAARQERARVQQQVQQRLPGCRPELLAT